MYYRYTKKPKASSYFLINSSKKPLENGSIEAGRSKEITAPDSRIFIEMEDGKVVLLGNAPSGQNTTFKVSVEVDYITDELGNNFTDESFNKMIDGK